MVEYIDRQAVLNHKRKMQGFGFAQEDDFWDFAVLVGDIEKIPTADVQEVKHGHWQITEYDYYDCSVCGNSYYNGCESGAEARQRLDERPYDVYKYCPYCGAKMGGEQ